MFARVSVWHFIRLQLLIVQGTFVIYIYLSLFHFYCLHTAGHIGSSLRSSHGHVERRMRVV